MSPAVNTYMQLLADPAFKSPIKTAGKPGAMVSRRLQISMALSRCTSASKSKWVLITVNWLLELANVPIVHCRGQRLRLNWLGIPGVSLR